jgi:hypothetical protein
MKTIDDLPKDWGNIIISGMDEGNSKERTIINLGLTWPVHVRFIRDYPEYKEKFEEGELHLIARIKDLLMKASKGEIKTQANVLIFMAKNMLGWRSEPFVEDKKGGLLTDKTEEKEIIAKFTKELDKREKEIKSIN